MVENKSPGKPKINTEGNKYNERTEVDHIPDGKGDAINQTSSSFGIGVNKGTTNIQNLNVSTNKSVEGNAIQVQTQQLTIHQQNGCETKKSQVERLVITLNGINFEKFIKDKEIQEALSLLLQKASGDTSVNFEKIEEGSIKITLNGSPEGLERLANLIQSGELGEDLEKLGLSIEEVQILANGLERSNPFYNRLKADLGIRGLLLMYIGNLEGYQGIDLLLESFALTQQQNQQADLVIIGGEASDIAKYQVKAQDLGISEKVYFLGPRPVEDLALYLAQADILVSPRTKGKSTPMKLYSYLDSGKALLATDLPVHTQLLDNRIAMLAAPHPEAFAAGMVSLLEDASLRSQLGSAGRNLLRQNHTYQAFRNKLNSLYDWLKQKDEEEDEAHWYWYA